MTELKLNRLPDRMPVKITVTVPPDINKALLLYAELYRESYGDEENVADLIPTCCRVFLTQTGILPKHSGREQPTANYRTRRIRGSDLAGADYHR